MPSTPDREFAERLLDELENAAREEVVKPWGREVMFITESFILKFIEINDGHHTSLQVHDVKDEVTMPINNGGYRAILSPDEDAPPTFIFHNRSLRVRPGTIHQTVGPITLLEVTTPENDDIRRLKDKYGR